MEEEEVETDDVEVETAASGNGEAVFPIADYDDLKVGEIVSLLPELDEEELEMVREREESGKNRSTILTRVEALSGASGGDGDWKAEERHWDSWRDEEADEGKDEEEDEEEEDEGAIFPIADYDELKAAEVVSLLPELDDEELDEVREHEARGASRATVLNRIDQLLGNEPEPEPEPARKAPARRAPAKKTTARKSPAKKTAAKKTAAKKTAAKKTTAKRTPAKRTPAKRTPAKKTAARKR